MPSLPYPKELVGSPVSPIIPAASLSPPYLSHLRHARTVSFRHATPTAVILRCHALCENCVIVVHSCLRYPARPHSYLVFSPSLAKSPRPSLSCIHTLSVLTPTLSLSCILTLAYTATRGMFCLGGDIPLYIKNHACYRYVFYIMKWIFVHNKLDSMFLFFR